MGQDVGSAFNDLLLRRKDRCGGPGGKGGWRELRVSCLRNVKWREGGLGWGRPTQLRRSNQCIELSVAEG